MEVPEWSPRRSAKFERRSGLIKRIGDGFWLVHLMVNKDLAEFLEDAGLFVADGFGGDSPLEGDFGRGLAHEGVLNQRGLARAKGLIDCLLECVTSRSYDGLITA